MDKSVELPSDRYWSTWQDKKYTQDWTGAITDPLNPIDRQYVNYWVKIWVRQAYTRLFEISEKHISRDSTIEEWAKEMKWLFTEEE